MNKPKVADHIDLSGKQRKKWVVNISKHKLAKDESTVLAKVLNYAVVHEKILHNEFIVATKLAATELIRQHHNKYPSRGR